MRYRRPLLAAALCASLGLIACPPTASIDDAEAAIRADLARGDRRAAVARLEALPSLEEPSDVLRVADLYLQLGEATRARWRLEEGIARHPDEEGLWLALARVSLWLSDPRAARAATERIPPTSDRHPSALMLRARAALALGELDTGLALYDAFAERYPERPEALLARIATLANENRLEEALVSIEDATQEALHTSSPLHDSITWLGIQRARILARLDRAQDAVTVLRELVRDRPEVVEAWEMLVELEGREGRAEQLADEIVAAVAADPTRRALYPLAAAAHRRAGRQAEANALIETILAEAPSARALLAVAAQRIAAGKHEAALALFAEATERFPEDAQPLLMRFDLHLMLDRRGDALRNQLALESLLAESDPALDYVRARLELADGDAGAARARLERIAPEFNRAPTQFWLGAALDELGDAEGARMRYSAAMRLEPTWPLPRHVLWRHALASADWAAVVAHGRALLMSQPDDPEVWRSVVRGLCELGEGDAALSEARRARERMPEEASLVASEARALRELGRLDESLALLEEARVRYSAAGPLWSNEHALALASSGRLEEASAVLQAALVDDPKDEGLLYVQSSVYYAMGRAEEGDRVTDALLSFAPERADARYNRCRFRVASGRYAEAREDCAHAARAMSENAEVHFVHGIVLERSGDSGAARAAYDRAIDLDESDVRPRINLAELHSARGEFDHALTVAQAAYFLAPEHPNLLDLLSRLYLRKGLAQRALLFLEDAMRLAPGRRDLSPRVAELRERVLRNETPNTIATQVDLDSDAASSRATSPSEKGRLVERLTNLERTNLVLFLVDTLRADTTTPYGHPQGPTPEIARWAARGAVFERVRSQSSWTKMSMASLMTSLWPRSHGIVEADDGIGEQAVTLAEVLQQAGFATYAVQTNGWLHQSFGFHQGFDRYLFPRGVGGPRFEQPSMWPHADRVVAEGVEMIERRDPKRPFFLYLHFMDVHEYAAPPEFKRYGTSARGNYIAAVRWVDDAIQRVRQALEEADVLDETILIFAADHGETFGEHGVHGHARNVLSPVVDVPLVIRFPFALEEPIRVRGQVRNLDIAPTLLELAGIKIPPSFEGESLLPLLTGEEPDSGRISFARLGVPLFSDASAQSTVHDMAWTYARNADADSEDPRSWRSRAAAPGVEMLFDHATDPGENVDLVEKVPDEAARLRTVLEAHLVAGEAGVREKGIRIDPGIAQKLRALGYLR